MGWVGALLTLLLAAGVAGPAVAGEPAGFVRDRVSLNQTMEDLLKGRFTEEVKCAEACTMATRLVIAPQDAKALGFKGVRAGKWFEIGRVENVQLQAGGWTKAKMRVSPAARKRLAAAKTGLKIAGQVLAESKESGRHGWADWIRTCNWPRR